MAVSRQDRQFVDISLSFLRNPVSNDILLVKNENAIKNSIKNLIFTNLGERFFNPLLGSTVKDTLFDLADSISDLKIERSVKNVLENYEPRIKVNSVSSVYSEDSNECQIRIKYDIIGSEIVPQNLSFILKSTKL